MVAKALKSLILGGGVAAMFSSCAVHKLSLTAPKHRRIPLFAEIVLQGTSATRPRHISVIAFSRAAGTLPNPIKEAFSNYASCLHDRNDNQQKVWEASRRIEFLSRGVMNKIRRIKIHNKDEILKQAEKDLAVIVDPGMSRLVKKLQGTDFWTLGQDYSRGIQMYVGAATLCYFCRTGALLNLDEINAILGPLSDSSNGILKISVPDYLIGLAKMTEELAWLEYLQIINRESEFAKKIILGLTCVVSKMHDSHMLMQLDAIYEGVNEIENVLQDSESEIQEE